ncbi:hypothetical protein [Streptomyces mirabilis]|uniref:hypothetical protein n=1 Tax=Streptomyces mirabilis TaxID=68239 RepID=UPI0006CDC05A|nr:hypothetical protein OK006_3270 [Actinobacteria bacterium OK006]
MNNDRQIGVRTAVLLLAGAITVIVAARRPELGMAIGIGVAVVTLLDLLME